MHESVMDFLKKRLIPALVIVPIAGAVVLKWLQEAHPDSYARFIAYISDNRTANARFAKSPDLGRLPGTYGDKLTWAKPATPPDLANEASKGRYIVGREHRIISVSGACRYSHIPSRALELRRTDGYSTSITFLEYAIAAKKCIPLEVGDRVIVERIFQSGLAQVRLPGDGQRLWMVSAFIEKFK